MPFIGQQPTTGAFLELDSLTASATANYDLQLNGANYYPESVNNLLVSINGVIQGSNTLSLSGYTLTVGATLSASDVIDFVRVFGNVGTISTPTDGSVTANKIGTGAVTNAKIADSTLDLTSKVTGVLPVANGGTGQSTRPAWSAYLSIQQTTTDYTIEKPVPFDTEEFDIGGNLTVDTTNGAVFTAPIAGLYQFNTMVQMQNLTTAGYAELTMFVDDAYVGNNVDFTYRHIEDPQGGTFHTATQSSIIQLTANQTLTPYVRINGDTTIEVRAGCRFNGFLVG